MEKEVKNKINSPDKDHKNENPLVLHQKINNLLENEKNLMINLEKNKNNENNKMIEIKNFYDSKLASLKKEISHLELKLKENEKQKNSMIFEHEKEKSCQNYEMDNIKKENSDLKILMHSLNNKKEFLLRY